MDLALNNLQWLIYHKTKSNLTKPTPSPYTGFDTTGEFFLAE